MPAIEQALERRGEVAPTRIANREVVEAGRLLSGEEHRLDCARC